MLITKLCWICSLLGALHLIDSASLICYSGSLDNYDFAPLETAESLLNSMCYNSSLSNVIYTFGFRGVVNDTMTTAVLSSMLQLNDRNVFLFNWEDEARSMELSDYLRALSYVVYALPNAISVGLNLGEALSRMSDNGFNLNRTHLIGQSLGAHMFGLVGRYLIQSGKTVDRITGLDPARPFFEQPPALAPLGRECADFVDIIHTFPGAYGVKLPYGTVDIYANYGIFNDGTEMPVQPGCQFEILSEAGLCSHNRALYLLIESWSSNHTLQARKASNYSEWENSAENSTEIINIGYDIDRNASGIFYFTTNSEPPFGKGPDGLHP